jgi:hypothetical protein
MYKYLLALAFAILSGCATSYQPQSFSGGFTETQLDTNVFRVSFKGNGYTSVEKVEEMSLLRSADLTLKNGFTHFVIVNGRSRTDSSFFTTPTQSTTTGTISTFGNTSSLNATTHQTGGDIYNIAKPSTTNTIVCFQGKPANAGFVYDAQFVFNSLSKKYGVEGVSK